jgi:hypothetical protein
MFAMRRRTAKNVRELRDMAVLAVSRRGALERSGEASLAILHEQGLMIGYHTPFNPLPKMSDSARYDAALQHKQTTRAPYGIEIWLDGAGKVFSAGWAMDGEPQVKLCRSGGWQEVLRNIANAAPESEFELRKTKTPEIVATEQPVEPLVCESQRVRQLELENKNLRRAISGLMLDKLILAKAAAGNL